MTSELNRAADDTTLLIRARRIADWVGDGRAVTPKGLLKPADVPAAAAALGVPLPARFRSAGDVGAIHRPWVAAQGAGLLTVTGGRAVRADVTGDDSLTLWWAAVRAVLQAESPPGEDRAMPVLCRMLLTAASAGPAGSTAGSTADFPAVFRELMHQASVDDFHAVNSLYRDERGPVDIGLDFLGEAGAVHDRRITALGRWLLERMTEEWPPPLTPELSATEVLDRLAGLAGDEAWHEAGPWLAGRTADAAARELLTAAATAAPAQRLAAVDVASNLGDEALPAWREAAATPTLGPHARLVLADGAPDTEDADQGWFAVEYALAALSTDGPEEAYHTLREYNGVDTAGTGHPGEPELREALSSLIAAGGPPVPVYQLKISLSRVRPAVWRRIRLPATTTLDELHHIIRIAFDWDDDHLHVFTAGGLDYADPSFGMEQTRDESRARLSRVAPRAGATMTYVYDLGDHWEHRIVVERITGTASPDMLAVCVAGEGDAPVEDWIPGDGPETTPFDLEAINRRLSGDDAAPVAGTTLFDRAGDLKGELVAFSRQPRYDRDLTRFLTEHGGGTGRLTERQGTLLWDTFLLEHRLPSGRTVLEDFVAAHPELPGPEREMLLGWQDVVQGSFEVLRHEGPAVVVDNLVDDLTYRVRSNKGPDVFRQLGAGWFILGRLVAVGDEWMLSGSADLVRPEQRDTAYAIALEFSTHMPAAVFRNPEKLATAWEMQRLDRERFIRFFGTDQVVLPDDQVEARLGDYYAFARGETDSAPGAPLPETAGAETVALIYDEIDGLGTYTNFGRVAEAFADPDLLRRRRWREDTLSYLHDDSVEPMVLRRLADPDPANATIVFRRLLKRPSFEWTRDAEATLRELKPAYYAHPPRPSTTVLSDRLAAFATSRRVVAGT